MKKNLTVILACFLILSLTVWADMSVLAAGDPETAQTADVMGAGQPGAGEAEQWDLTQDLNYRYDNVVALLRSDAVSIYASRFKYEDTDDGRVLTFSFKITNLTEEELELEAHSIAGRVSSTWDRTLKPGAVINNSVAGDDYNWNGLIGETADCYQGTYQLTVMLDGQTTDTVQFDLYISETTPFCNVVTTNGGSVPADIRRPFIQETVVADEELFMITANRLEGSTLYVTFENKSDRTLEFTSVETDGLVNTVNGYENDTGTHEKVSPGESVESDIGLSMCSELGVEKIADIQHGFEVRDDDSNDLIALVPVHLQTSAGDYDYSGESFQKVVQDSEWMEQRGWTLNWFTDQVDYDCAGIRILSAALISRNDKEPELYVEMENTTDANLYFDTDVIALNGLYVSGSIDGTIVPAGKKAVSRQNRVYEFADEDEAALFGLKELYSLTVVGVTTTDVVNHSVNTDEPLGSQSFTLEFTDGGENGFSYQALEEVMNEGGIKLDKVSEFVETEKGISQYFAVVNNSGMDITIDCGYEGSKVNGMDAWIDFDVAHVLPDGGTGMAILRLYENDMAEYGISSAEDITDLEFVLKAYDMDKNVLLEKTISMN